MRWSAAEDAALLAWQSARTTPLRWPEAAAHMGACGHSRSAKQCRERYCHHLASDRGGGATGCDSSAEHHAAPRVATTARARRKRPRDPSVTIARTHALVPAAAAPAPLLRAAFCCIEDASVLGVEPGHVDDAYDLPLDDLTPAALQQLPPSYTTIQLAHTVALTGPQRALSEVQRAVNSHVLSTLWQQLPSGVEPAARPGFAEAALLSIPADRAACEGARPWRDADDSQACRERHGVHWQAAHVHETETTAAWQLPTLTVPSFRDLPHMDTLTSALWCHEAFE